MIKESYNIEGMVCAACSSAVEKVTGKLDGVKSSSVNLTTKQLSIEYDEKKCSQEKICSAVEKAGFGISLKDENSSTQNFSNENKSFQEKNKNENLHSQKIQLILIWITSLFLMYVSMGHMIKINEFTFPLPKLVVVHTPNKKEHIAIMVVINICFFFIILLTPYHIV
jgi:Cu+-exporting ATPase